MKTFHSRFYGRNASAFIYGRSMQAWGFRWIAGSSVSGLIRN